MLINRPVEKEVKKRGKSVLIVKKQKQNCKNEIKPEREQNNVEDDKREKR